MVLSRTQGQLPGILQLQVIVAIYEVNYVLDKSTTLTGTNYRFALIPLANDLRYVLDLPMLATYFVIRTSYRTKQY